MEYCIILITTSSLKEAKNISNALLKARLIACANIIRGVESLFWWQGKIDKSKEVLLVLKTRRKLFSAVSKLVRRIHSYQTPEIISFPLENIAPDYRRWLDASIRKSG